MIPKPLLSLALLLVFSPLLADGDKNDALVPPNQARLSGEVFTFSLHSDGSMYYPETWNPGRVTLRSGEVVEAEQLRYNGYLDQLIWLNTETLQQIQVDKPLVHSFTLQLTSPRDTLHFENITFKRWYETDFQNIFGQMMYRGEIRLLVHRQIVTNREISEVRGSTLVARAQLKADPIFYVLMPGNEAREIKRFNRKALYRLFPEHADQIREAFRQNHLRIRNEQELIQAVKIIDLILSKG